MYQARTRETSCTHSSLESDTLASWIVPAASRQHVAVYGIRDSHWMPRELRRHRACGRPWPWLSTRTVKRGERTGPLTTAGELSLLSFGRTFWISTRSPVTYRTITLLFSYAGETGWIFQWGICTLSPVTYICCEIRNMSSPWIKTTLILNLTNIFDFYSMFVNFSIKNLQAMFFAKMLNLNCLKLLLLF